MSTEIEEGTRVVVSPDAFLFAGKSGTVIEVLSGSHKRRFRVRLDEESAMFGSRCDFYPSQLAISD